MTYTTGHGELVSGIGSGTAAGKAAFIFQRIGYHDVGGVLRGTGTVIFSSNASGNLAFVGNTVGILKDVVCGPGCGMTKIWLWK